MALVLIGLRLPLSLWLLGRLVTFTRGDIASRCRATQRPRDASNVARRLGMALTIAVTFHAMPQSDDCDSDSDSVVWNAATGEHFNCENFVAAMTKFPFWRPAECGAYQEISPIR